MSTLSIQEFVKGCGGATKRWVGELLDKMTAGDHTKATTQILQVQYVVGHIQCSVHPTVCQMEIKPSKQCRTDLHDQPSLVLLHVAVML